METANPRLCFEGGDLLCCPSGTVGELAQVSFEVGGWAQVSFEVGGWAQVSFEVWGWAQLSHLWPSLLLHVSLSAMPAELQIFTVHLFRGMSVYCVCVCASV